MYERLMNLEQPRDDEMVWRYMDLARFVDLLATKSLYFARSDLMADKWEGVYGSANERMRLADGEAFTQKIRDSLEALRGTMFLSCWHVSPWQSAAMWELYQREGRGVAIQTTWGKLTKSLASSHVVVGSRVQYIDYAETIIPETNLFNPFVTKRLSYEHEREARLLYWSGAISNLALEGRSKEEPLWQESQPDGIKLAVTLSDLISTVVVAPDAPEWIVAVVRSLVQAYGFEFPITHSDLFNGPLR